MNYNGIFGYYNPVKKTGEIYDGRKARKNHYYATLPAPIVTLEGVTQAEFWTRLQVEINKAERGEA